MPGLRDLRRKMKAIKATRQVTKAMELVAASKMRKAVQNAVQLRYYAGASWDILQRVAGAAPDLHTTLAERPVRKVLAILFTSDRGLAGSLNAQMLRTTSQYIKQVQGLPTFESLSFIAIGRKGQQFLARSGQNVIAAFQSPSSNPSFRDIRPIVRLASQSFRDGTYDHVVLLYNDFVSILIQEATMKVLLPFSKSVLKDMMGSIVPKSKKQPFESVSASKVSGEYLFEPSAEAVIQGIVPLITEIQVYQALLEAVASEHSARMVAMRSATDNASGILDDLTLTYNQTRQANITAELAELSASKAALEG